MGRARRRKAAKRDIKTILFECSKCAARKMKTPACQRAFSNLFACEMERATSTRSLGWGMLAVQAGKSWGIFMDTSWRTRLQSLRSLWSLPGIGLLLLALEILGYIHLASFAVEIGTSMMVWTQSHPLVVLIAGFVWLACVVLWPDMKARLPKLPLTLHQRVHALQQTNEECAHRIKAVENYAENMLSRLPKAMADSYSFSGLIREVNDAIETYWQINALYDFQTNVVWRTPFSGWRPTNQTFDSANDCIKDGEKWARSLEIHVRHTRELLESLQMSNHPMLSSPLLKAIGSWINVRNNDSGEDFIKLLSMHRGELEKLRKDHAERLTASK
jgi:hypothetical protein